MASWTWYAGPWDAAPAPLKAGERVEVPAGMHRSSWWWLDEATQRDRGFLGTRFAVGPATRTLGDAPMFVRLPKGYTPRTPAGLLVWIDPSPVGHHPGIFEAVADELNLAVVGVGKSGNTVLMGDRTQKVLDAVATALTLVHVDRARVYATGISGGGRMSGIVLFAFPDLFTGGVAMAGVPHYEDKPTPEGRVWPRYVNRPSGSRLEMVRGHRFAAISGAKDYNHAQTAATIGWQQADGMDVRLWSIPDLGHELPDAGTYAEALRWVDERARAGWEASVKLGDSLWKAVPPESTSRHEGLRRVMREAAWTPGAWKAAVALGIAGESESAGAR
jgi:predicted esterase